MAPRPHPMLIAATVALGACAPSSGSSSDPAVPARSAIAAPAPVPACTTVATCAEACDRGRMRGCYELGRRLRRGVEVAQDLPRAFVALERGCDGGVLDACAELGALHRFGDGVERDVERARELYSRACDGGSQIGCAALGALYQTGVSSLGRDLPRAHALFRSACTAREQTACTMLALAILRGEVNHAPEDPVALLDTACAADVPEACALRGELFLQGHRSEKDPRAAVALLDRACRGGASAGCIALGYLHHEGKVLTRDPARGDALFREACDFDGRACGHLASRLRPSDPALAAELYGRACEQTDATSCRVLAEMIEAGEGAPADAERAAELVERACRLEPSSCPSKR